MASNIVQAAAGVLQAFAGLVEAGTGVAGLGVTGINARLTLDNSHSRMQEKMLKLDTISASIEDKFRRYWFPQKQYNKWSDSVKAIILELKKLQEKFLDSKNTWAMQISSLKALSDEINVKCTKIDEVINEGKELEVALEQRDTSRIIKLVTPISIAHIPSFMQNMKDLLLYVKNEKYNTIRVQGVPGIGKTLLIQHLNNLQEAQNMFDIVIWVPASDFENRHEGNSIEVGIQRIVARRLGMRIAGIQDDNVIASKIHAELDGAKYLLLLDDVKVNINLETIGIPTNTQGSKIVYTTNIGVFPFGVAPHHQFDTLRMKELPPGDSWQIFEDILIRNGNDSIRQRDIRPIAHQVIKLCGGLFSVIKILAENFKFKKTPAGWANCLKILETTPKQEDILMEALRKFLSFSYGNLEENEKKCFLFCVLYPEDNKIPVDCLYDCWAANNLLQTDVLGEDMLHHLLTMALLKEVGLNKQYVTIDKICRQAAMKILQEHDKLECLVASEADTKLQRNDCKDICWISLANSGIDVLPIEVDCPKLETLFLQKNPKLKTFSSSFFRDINELLVLDLHKTGLESVLIPMSHMQKLKVLYVNGCPMLKEINFKIEGPGNKLEVLDIRGCIINEIPHDIKRLMHLRRLIVSIDPRTLGDLKISELSSLNELIIDVTSEDKDENPSMLRCNQVIEDVLEKIDTSKELTTLTFHFKDDIADVIQVWGNTLRIFVPKQGNLKHIWKERRKHYRSTQLYIGSRMTSTDKIPEFSNSFVLSHATIVSDNVIEEVMVEVQALIMMEENSMEHLDQTGISQNSMHHIHHCLLHRCNKIETLMQTVGFSKLKTLVLSECSQLKVLFSANVVQQVMCIERLEIRDCPAIGEINMLSTTSGDILPTLRTLILHNLPMVKEICSDMEWPMLSTLKIHKCPKLTKLPLNENSAKNLCNIRVEKMWWEGLKLGSEINKRFEGCCIFSD